MTNVDVDGDASTFNSSSATVSLPAGATVAWVVPHPGADTTLGTGGTAAPIPASRGSVRFKAASGSYQTAARSQRVP